MVNEQGLKELGVVVVGGGGKYLNHFPKIKKTVRCTNLATKSKLFRMVDFVGVGLRELNRLTPGLTGITGFYFNFPISR